MRIEWPERRCDAYVVFADYAALRFGVWQSVCVCMCVVYMIALDACSGCGVRSLKVVNGPTISTVSGVQCTVYHICIIYFGCSGVSFYFWFWLLSCFYYIYPICYIAVHQPRVVIPPPRSHHDVVRSLPLSTLRQPNPCRMSPIPPSLNPFPTPRDTHSDRIPRPPCQSQASQPPLINLPHVRTTHSTSRAQHIVLRSTMHLFACVCVCVVQDVLRVRVTGVVMSCCERACVFFVSPNLI